MFLFPHLTESEIEGAYQFKGIAYFCVPIYGRALPGSYPTYDVYPRNWIPYWSVPVAGFFFNLLFGWNRFFKYAIIKTKTLPQNYRVTDEHGNITCVCSNCVKWREAYQSYQAYQEREEQSESNDDH